MRVQIRIFEQTVGRNVPGVITFTQNLDMLLPQVPERGIPGQNIRIMFGKRQAK